MAMEYLRTSKKKSTPIGPFIFSCVIPVKADQWKRQKTGGIS